MPVLKCSSCGEQVNSEVPACPNCGMDPRLSSEESSAELERRATTADERRDQMIQDASGSERYTLLKRDPIALARYSRDAGLQVLQIDLTGETVDEWAEQAINGHGLGLIEAIESEGWRLDSWRPVYRPSGISSVGGSVGGIGLGVNRIEGSLIHCCLFRRPAVA